ncbi:MAG: hypothetical protein JO339_28685 [Alphaproteobacteria bacterium]|nr:hypothetical protein [Alphaproteobacteria bacterium]
MDQPSALAASIGIESIIVAILLARLGWAKVLRGIAAATLGTIVTHPLAWWSIVALEPAIGYWAAVALVEALVCLAESLAYRLLVPLVWPLALAMSVAANAASTLAGFLYYAYAGFF